MARDHARVNLDIWNDPDFRALPMSAQHLYLVLWTHPDLTYCGSIDWRPARLSGLTEGADRTGIEEAAACLQARHFLVVDEGTEEALVRSWIKFDGLMKQPRMAISCVTAYGAMGSDTLRKVVVHELTKVREALPDLAAWGDERVARVLGHPAVSAKDLPTPSDPFGDGLTPSLAQTQPKGKGSVCTPPTPAPAPTPLSAPLRVVERESPEAPDRFEEWWDAYDKKVGKKSARTKWDRALKKKGVTPDLLIEATRTYVASQRAQNKHPEFTKNPTTWLNGEHWNDEQPRIKQPKAAGWWNQ